MKKRILFIIAFIFCAVYSNAQIEISSGGVAGAYTLTVPGVFTLKAGIQVTFKANVVCAAGVTMNVNGTGAKIIKKEGGATNLSANDIVSGQVVNLVYDGTNWQMLSASGAPSTSGANVYLSNLSSPTSVNQNLLTNSPSSFDLGSATYSWKDVYADGMYYLDGAPWMNNPNGSNTMIGTRSANGSLTTALYNTAVGSNSGGGITTGARNSLFGHGAGQNLNSQSDNTLIGALAGGLASNLGSSNTFLGSYAGYGVNNAGSNNTLIGYQSGPAITTGGNNVALGYYSAYYLTTGSNNVIIGNSAGFTNPIYTTSNNTFIGNNTGFGSATERTNSTAIGANAQVDADNAMVLGNNVNVGIGTSAPHSSSILDLSSTSRGVLVPRMTPAQMSAIVSPATGLLIFNTGANKFMYYNGVAWVAIDPSPSTPDWSTGGNGGTSPGTNYLGTSDAQDLVFKTTATERMRINAAGKMGINGTSPNANYDLYDFRPGSDWGPDHTGVYSYRSGTGGAASGGTSWAVAGVDAAIKGANYYGNNYTAGVVGYNYHDYNITAGVLGSDWTGSNWGALSYKDASNTIWGLYTPNSAYIGGNIQMPTGAANNYVLKSDVSGNASWADASTLFSGPWSKSGMNIYLTTATDNVGLGTNAPGAKLDVNPGGSFGGVVLEAQNSNASNSNPVIFAMNSGPGSGISSNASGTGDAVYAYSSGGGNAISAANGGTSGNVAFLQTSNSANTSATLYLTSNGTSGTTLMSNNSGAGSAGSFNNASTATTLFVQNTGVGNAGYFAGKVAIVDGTQANGKVFVSDAGGNGSWQSASSLVGIGVSWSAITAPTAPNTISHGTNLTTFNFANTAADAFDMNFTAATTGSGLVLAGTNATLTGNIFRAQSATTAAVTNGIVRFNFTGAHTGNGLQVDDITATGTAAVVNANSLTTGTALSINTSSLTTGSALNITSSSAAGNGSKLLNLASTGATASPAMSNYGVYSSVAKTNATSGTNFAGYFTAAGTAGITSNYGVYSTLTGPGGSNVSGFFNASGATNNYAIIVPASGGNVGIGTTTPSSLLHVNYNTAVASDEIGTRSDIVGTGGNTKIGVFGYGYTTGGTGSTGVGVVGVGNSNSSVGAIGVYAGLNSNAAGTIPATLSTSGRVALLAESNGTNDMAYFMGGGGVGIGTTGVGINSKLSIKDGHIQTQQTAATGFVAGNSTLGACSGTDVAGVVNFNPTAATSGVMITVTFNKIYSSTSAPVVILSPANATSSVAIGGTAGSSGGHNVYVTATGSANNWTGFTISYGVVTSTVPAVSGLANIFNYMVIQNQ